MKAAPLRSRLAKWGLVPLLVLVGAVLPAAGEYRILELDGLKIVFDSDWAGLTAPGYFPVRFDITNLGEARAIEIVGETSRSIRVGRGGSQNGGSGLRQAVRLARGDRVRLTIPVPVYGDYETLRFEIRENGRVLERFGFMSLRSRALPVDAAVLIVADADSDLGRAAGRRLRTMTGGGSVVYVPPGAVAGSRGTPYPAPSGRVVGPSIDFVLDAERLPTNWLGYTSLRAVVIDPNKWDQLTDVQKTALLTWTACGGDLVVVDADVTRLLPPDTLPATADPLTYDYLFGRIKATTTAAIHASSVSGVLNSLDTGRNRAWSLPANFAPDWGAIATRGFRLPIPGIDGIPARTYLAILVLFAVLIGPVNYWWLSRHRRQVLVVLTAPIISAVFIMLLAAYAIAGDGFGVYGRAITFTMLDQVKRQAVTRASFSLYAAGMSPSGGLQFPRDVAVFPLGVSGNGPTTQVQLNLTDSQRFAAGLAQARTATNVETVAFRQARERVSFSRGPEGVTVINGLEATIVALDYRDGDRHFGLAAPLPPGGKTVLTTGSAQIRQLLPLTALPAPKLLSVIDNQPTGTYLAVLDRSPFWNSGVSNLVERGSFHLVLGRPDGAS